MESVGGDQLLQISDLNLKSVLYESEINRIWTDVDKKRKNSVVHQLFSDDRINEQKGLGRDTNLVHDCYMQKIKVVCCCTYLFVIFFYTVKSFILLL